MKLHYFETDSSISPGSSKTLWLYDKENAVIYFNPKETTGAISFNPMSFNQFAKIISGEKILGYGGDPITINKGTVELPDELVKRILSAKRHDKCLDRRIESLFESIAA